MSFENRTWDETFREQGPCAPGELWARQFSSAQEAWEACDNPLWMAWALQAFGPEDNTALTEILIKCIKHTLDMPVWFREALDLPSLADLVIDNPFFNKIRNNLLTWTDGDGDADDVIYALGQAVYPRHNQFQFGYTNDVLSALPDFIRTQVPNIMEWVKAAVTYR